MRHADLGRHANRSSSTLRLLVAAWFRPGHLEALLTPTSQDAARQATRLDRRVLASVGKATTVAGVLGLMLGLICGGGPRILVGCALAYALTWGVVALGVWLRQPAWGVVLGMSCGLLCGLPFVLASALPSGITRDLAVSITGGLALGAGLRRLAMPRRTRGAVIWMGILLSVVISTSWAFTESLALGGAFLWPLWTRFTTAWFVACATTASGLTLLVPEMLVCSWIKWLPPTSHQRLIRRMSLLPVVWDETQPLPLPSCTRLFRQALHAHPQDTLPVLYDIATKSAHPRMGITLLRATLIADDSGPNEMHDAQQCDAQQVLHRLSCLVHADIQSLDKVGASGVCRRDIRRAGFWLREEQRKRHGLFRILAWHSPDAATRSLATAYGQLHAAYEQPEASIVQRLAGLAPSAMADNRAHHSEVVESWRYARQLLSLSHETRLTELAALAEQDDSLLDGALFASEAPLHREPDTDGMGIVHQPSRPGVTDIITALQEGIQAWTRYAQMPASAYRTRHLDRAMRQWNLARRQSDTLAGLADAVVFKSTASHLLRLVQDVAHHDGIMPHLDLRLLTPEIVVDALPTITEVAFDLDNTGALDITEASASIETDTDIIDSWAVTSPWIKVGESCTIRIPLTVHDTGTVSARVRVSYASASGSRQEQTFDRRLLFVPPGSTARVPPLFSGTITPMVAFQESAFVGREAAIEWVTQHIQSSHLIVSGPPLIGKTWLLRQLERMLSTKDRAAIYWAAQPAPFSERGYQFWVMALGIANALGEAAPEVGEREDWATDWHYTFGDYVRAADRMTSGRRIVILVDDIMRWIGGDHGDATNDILGILLSKDHRHIRFVLAGTLDLVDLKPITGMEQQVFVHRLGAMTKSETRRILHRRSGHGRDYGSLAVDTIHQATGGHPWLIHLIAERLHANAPNSQQSIVTASDVQAALEACAHDTEGGLIEIWRALHPDERSVMFEIAHSSPDEEWVSVDDLRAALTRSKQYVTTSELASLLDRIHVGGLLIRTERHGQFLYQHAFPLFAHWCRG